jgi:hypothetical protein
VRLADTAQKPQSRSQPRLHENPERCEDEDEKPRLRTRPRTQPISAKHTHCTASIAHSSRLCSVWRDASRYCTKATVEKPAEATRKPPREKPTPTSTSSLVDQCPQVSRCRGRTCIRSVQTGSHKVSQDIQGAGAVQWAWAPCRQGRDRQGRHERASKTAQRREKMGPSSPGLLVGSSCSPRTTFRLAPPPPTHCGRPLGVAWASPARRRILSKSCQGRWRI